MPRKNRDSEWSDTYAVRRANQRTSYHIQSPPVSTHLNNAPVPKAMIRRTQTGAVIVAVKFSASDISKGHRKVEVNFSRLAYVLDGMLVCHQESHSEVRQRELH